jgi:hypothetical protein
MSRVERVAATGLVALMSMSLLTELGSTENGVGYRYGAPNGAGRKPDSINNSEKPTFELRHFALGVLSCVIPTNPVLRVMLTKWRLSGAI